MSRSLSWLAKNVVLDLVDRARQMGVARLSGIAMRAGLRLIKCAALALAFWMVVLGGVAVEAWRPMVSHWMGFPLPGMRMVETQVVWSAPVNHEALCRWMKSSGAGSGSVECIEVGGVERLVVRDPAGVLDVAGDVALDMPRPIPTEKLTYDTIQLHRHVLDFETQRRHLFNGWASKDVMEKLQPIKWTKATVDSSQVVLAAKELAGLAPLSDASLPWLGEHSHIGSAGSLGMFIACVLGNSIFGWFFALMYASPVALAVFSLAYVVKVIKGSNPQQVVLAVAQTKQGMSKAWGWVHSSTNSLGMICATLAALMVGVGMVMVGIGAIYPWLHPWASIGNHTPMLAHVDACRLDAKGPSWNGADRSLSPHAVCRKEGEASLILISQAIPVDVQMMDAVVKREGRIFSKDGVVHVSAKADLGWRGGDEPAWSLRSWREYWGFAPITEASRSWGLSMRTKVGENAGWSLSGVAAFGSVLSAWAMEGILAFPHVFLTWILLPCVGLAISAWVVKSAEGKVKEVGRKALGSAPVNEFISRAEARELARVVKQVPKSESRARGRL